MMQSAEPPITVVHYEYLDWPDFSTPPSTLAVRELVRALYSIPPQAGPFVVHCRSDFLSPNKPHTIFFLSPPNFLLAVMALKSCDFLVQHRFFFVPPSFFAVS